MDEEHADHGTVNKRRLCKLLKDGLSSFFGAYYTPWHWWCNWEDVGDPEIYERESVARAWKLLIEAVEHHSGMSTDDARLYARLLLETTNSGDEYSDLDGLVDQLRETCVLFGENEKDRPDFPIRARRAVIAAVTALLLDDGRLTGTLIESRSHNWTAEADIDPKIFSR